MTRWLCNLLGGAATVLQLSPPPVRYRFGTQFLDRTMADDFRQDWENIGRDMSIAIQKAYGRGLDATDAGSADRPHETVGGRDAPVTRAGVA